MHGADGAAEIREGEHREQQARQNDRDDEGDQQRPAHHDVAEDEEFCLGDRRHAVRLAAERHQQAVLQHEAEAQRQLDDHQHVPADDACDDRGIEQGAAGREDRHGDEDGDVRVERQRAVDREAQEHAERQEIAVRKIHDARHAVDEAEAERDESVGRADEQALDGGLEEDVHHGLRPSRFILPRKAGEVARAKRETEGARTHV